MKKQVRDKFKEYPFSPSLISLLSNLSLQFNKAAIEALNKEAIYLKLPKGSEYDMLKKVWKIPTKGE